MTIETREVYDALNIYEQWRYKENEKYEQKFWECVLAKYEIYKSNGGNLDLKYFKDTLSDYLLDGYCGY